jgi:hypothetical protein
MAATAEHLRDQRHNMVRTKVKFCLSEECLKLFISTSKLFLDIFFTKNHKSFVNACVHSMHSIVDFIVLLLFALHYYLSFIFYRKLFKLWKNALNNVDIFSLSSGVNSYIVMIEELRNSLHSVCTLAEYIVRILKNFNSSQCQPRKRYRPCAQYIMLYGQVESLLQWMVVPFVLQEQFEFALTAVAQEVYAMLHSSSSAVTK